ncbi:hypothetical protein XO11_03805 [Marinitoga sp. 1138]|uniref:tetratricopeptide repeat protein n=2 Tax=unclassified Marinitoga TaxID=2640159 RepID=UPI000950858B|nr:tetratricopeptide repeat protein [Marinitoga sp. 1137]APT75686.1 hypothetical protein LN42_04255 [Marinitoga sp. 1137]NUU97354.1 hypothetical protein [Marinitoga sp. 1138]
MRGKLFIIIYLLLFIILSFSTSIEDIKNLSKMPSTLDDAWAEFVKYLAENPGDPSIGIIGEVISAKQYFYNKYKNAPFIEPLIEERFNKFCSSLGLYNSTFSEDETNLILKIFPQIPLVVKRTLETGIMESNAYKYLYKLNGLEKYVMPFSYTGFLQLFVDKSITSPVFLDKDMEKFVSKFVPHSKLQDINSILNNSTYFLDENNYLGGFKLLDFLKREGIIDSKELKTYSLLKQYFDLKKEIGQLASNIYLVDIDKLKDFTINVLDLTNKVINLDIKKESLYTLLNGVIKTIRIRIESSNKIIFDTVPENLDKLIDSSSDPLKSELLKLKEVIVAASASSKAKSQNNNTTESTTSQKGNENKSTVVSKNDNNTNSTKKHSLITYIILIAILVIVSILTIPYFFVSHKSIEFYMKLKMFKTALKLAEKLVIKNPDDYKAYILMARILEELNEVDQAMMAYKMAHKKRQSQDSLK